MCQLAGSQKYMRFGESFPQGADPKNRMDVLKTGKEQSDPPAYIKFGLEIRSALKSQVEKEGWPALPNQEKINSAADIFETAKDEVNQTWEQSVQGLIENKSAAWRQTINPDDPETDAVLTLLNNPAEFSQSFSLRQFGVLESLRTVNPEAWRTLVVASSERQLASIAVMEHWLKDGDPQILRAIGKKIGLSPEELKLFVDLAAMLGKYIDHAYVKQIELADLPGGSEETKLNDEPGSQYLYDLYKDPRSEDIDIKTYTEIFPYEWDKIQSRLEALSARVKSDSAAGRLPVGYVSLADYLQQAARVYGSQSIEPAVLDKEWDDLYQAAQAVSNADCPIMMVTQGGSSSAGEAGKIDAEIRLGLRTKETKEQENDFQAFTEIAQKMLDAHKRSLAKDYQIPNVRLNYQPWAFGPNLYWMTRGESNEHQILSHTNAVTEVATAKEVPLLGKMFKTEHIEESAYARAAEVGTVLHEISHNVLDQEDKKVGKRVGQSFEAEILEELKAETLDIRILLEAAQRGVLPAGVDMKSQLLAKLGTNLDYLKNKSDKKASTGEPYYICGTAIFSRLLEKGLIKKGNSSWSIGDIDDCLKEIAAISDQVLSFYLDNNSKPADVKNYIRDLRAKGQSPLIKDLVNNL